MRIIESTVADEKERAERIKELSVFGYPDESDGKVYNGAAIIENRCANALSRR